MTGPARGNNFVAGSSKDKRSAAPRLLGRDQRAALARTIVGRSMPKVPQLPHSGNPARRPGGSGPWIDLIAFLAVLTLGGVLMALGRTTAGSLATICAALGGLYAIWKRPRFPDGPSSTDEIASKPDEPPH